MAGTIVGSIDHAVTVLAPTVHQNLFVNAYNFFATQMVGAGHCTLVASNFGSGGTGFDYQDGANPAGENAWACFRFPNTATPFDILIQWADTAAFGAAPGNPGLLQGNNAGAPDGVGIVAALREDGTDPWGGTTGSPGSDTKGATVWTPGGSVVHSLMRSNNLGGSHNALKQNTAYLLLDTAAGSPIRHHMWGDADGVFFLTTRVADTYLGEYIGKYNPPLSLTVPHPYVHVTNVLSNTVVYWPLGSTNAYGTLTGNSSAAEEGGILSVPLSDGVVAAGLSAVSLGIADAIFTPNQLYATPSLEHESISVFKQELGTSTRRGLAGVLPESLVASVYNVATHETNAAGTRAYMGSTVVASRKWSVVWDGGSPPGTLNVRQGRQF